MESLNEIYQYPTGMLDRDQRTAMTANYENKNLNFIKKNYYKLCEKLKKLNNNCCDNLYNNNNYDNLNYNKININSNKKNYEESKDLKQNIIKRNKNYRNRVPKSCQKVSNYLLICFYFWIYSVQLISSAPTMADNTTLNPEERDELETYLLGLRDAYHAAYGDAKTNLSDYLEFSNNDNYISEEGTNEFHESWSGKNEPALYDQPDSTNFYIPTYFHKDALPEQHVEKIKQFNVYNKNELVILLKEIYIRFSRLKMALVHVVDTYNSTQSDRSTRIINIINNSFKNIDRIRNETRLILEELLKEELPPVSQTIKIGVENELLRNWIVYRELLNQISFDRKTLDILINTVKNKN